VQSNGYRVGVGAVQSNGYRVGVGAVQSNGYRVGVCAVEETSWPGKETVIRRNCMIAGLYDFI